MYHGIFPQRCCLQKKTRENNPDFRTKERNCFCIPGVELKLADFILRYMAFQQQNQINAHKPDH